MEDRNILWLVFTQSDWRVTIVDWYDVVGRLVAEFRAAMAEHLAATSSLNEPSQFTVSGSVDTPTVAPYARRLRRRLALRPRQA